MRNRHDAKAATASTRGPAFTPGCIEPISVLTDRALFRAARVQQRPNCDPVFLHPGITHEVNVENALQILPNRTGPTPLRPAKTDGSCTAFNGYNDVMARLKSRTGLEMTSADVTAGRHQPILPYPNTCSPLCHLSD